MLHRVARFMRRLLTGAWRRPFRARPVPGVPGLYREVSGPRAAREAKARADVHREIAREPHRCWVCFYRFLRAHSTEGLRLHGRDGGEHHLRLQEYAAALDELARLGRETCTCGGLPPDHDWYTSAVT